MDKRSEVARGCYFGDMEELADIAVVDRLSFLDHGHDSPESEITFAVFRLLPDGGDQGRSRQCLTRGWSWGGGFDLG